ncbi:EAL domain-containing protein [Nitrosovibrio sp. Nv17]|uniref:EAL domain-containing protein n=1 Tax=Nitrosovibrio sp. Nv17 TaxID=1855339 RepID=UPI0009089EE0|nr:EAL domain-containing protein [Nitrosovibrio sp. Nv17]SFW10848.1 EAL domain, c-di-GMP-specific phosphodiesterase class I (or its enzymatically inactive variant) [Nitrosovibrio sp. Nv17]
MSSPPDELVQIQATTDSPLRRSEDGWITAHFSDRRLSSAFQPVIDARTRQVAGHAAYVRCGPGHQRMTLPRDIFALATEDRLLVKLDRLCRTLHAFNYFNVANGLGWLSVNVQPRLLESVKDDHGRAFSEILNLIGITPSRVVIEIPVEVNRDWRLFKRVVGNYRSHGYRIAANHSGAAGWMPQLRDLYPDVLRLEASSLLHHSDSAPLREDVHRFGAVLLVHGIETRQQMAAAFQVGAGLLQGRLLGGPVSRVFEAADPGIFVLQRRLSIRLPHPPATA